MANTTLKVRNRIATKTTSEWETENPVLLKGEMGYDSTSKRYKIGDGVKTWNKLQYEIDTGVLSSGQQLVVNGNGILGDNTNFSQLVYDPTMSFNGSPGVFKQSKDGVYSNITESDLFIPIDTTKKYKMSIDITSIPDTKSMRNYMFLTFYDINKYLIRTEHNMYFQGSTTTLARDLKKGDTEIYVTDLSGFTHKSQTNQRAIIFWDYKNSYGYQYPKETYSRNYNQNLWTNEEQLDYTNNKIILDKPWSGKEHLAGCDISQNNSEGTYKYLKSDYVTSLVNWSSVIGEVDYSGTNVSGKFSPGIAYVKVAFLLNYSKTANARAAISNIRLEEITEDLRYPLTLFNKKYNGTTSLTIVPSDVVGAMEDGNADITDNTEFITSNVNGFNYSGSVNVPYRRKATYIWNWIKNKIETVIKPIIHRGSNTYVYSGDDSAKYSYQSWVNCLPFIDSNGDTRYALEILPGESDTITYNNNTYTITNNRTTTIIVVLYIRNTNIVQDVGGIRAKCKIKHKSLINYGLTTFNINQTNDDFDIVQFSVSYNTIKYSKSFKNTCSVLVWLKSSNNIYSSGFSVASGNYSVASG